MTRRRLRPRAGLKSVSGDVLSGHGLGAALDGCDVAYYLVHSMEAAGDDAGDFAARDRRAAENFADAARTAGVRRIVYLGGIAPVNGSPSPHLASRLEVERTLLGLAPQTTALRASILIGAGSSSFRMLVRLVERLRLLPLPAWRSNRTQPIAERDAIEFLARSPHVPEAEGRALDIAGPDVLTYGAMVERIAELMGVGRTRVRLGVSLTPPASALVSAVTQQPLELVRPLMESLEHELLPARCRRGARHVRDQAARLRARRGTRARGVGADRGAGRAMKLEHTTLIAAPPEAIYDVVTDPQRLEDWVTIHEELVEAPPASLKKGSKLTQQLRLAGKCFTVHWTVVQSERPRKMVWKGSGPVRSKASVTYEFEPNGAGTCFSYVNEYHLPGGPLGKLAAPLVDRVTKGELEASLEKLRALVE